MCFSPLGLKESDMTEQLNNKNMFIENNHHFFFAYTFPISINFYSLPMQETQEM